MTSSPCSLKRAGLFSKACGRRGSGPEPGGTALRVHSLETRPQRARGLAHLPCAEHTAGPQRVAPGQLWWRRPVAHPVPLSAWQPRGVGPGASVGRGTRVWIWAPPLWTAGSSQVERRWPEPRPDLPPHSGPDEPGPAAVPRSRNSGRASRGSCICLKKIMSSLSSGVWEQRQSVSQCCFGERAGTGVVFLQ